MQSRMLLVCRYFYNKTNVIMYLLTGYEGIASLLSPRHWQLTEAKPKSIVKVEGTTNLIFGAMLLKI